MTRMVLTAVLAVVCSLVVCAQAAAQTTTQTFMLVPNIHGDSTDSQHRDWIDVFSVTQGFSSDQRESGCTVQVTKPLDKSGPKLWAAAVTGQRFNEIRIEIFTNPGDRPLLLYELTLSNVSVTSIVTSINSSTGDLVEQLALTGASVALRFQGHSPDGRPTGPVASMFSCR